jgi:hypothetical protein
MDASVSASADAFGTGSQQHQGIKSAGVGVVGADPNRPPHGICAIRRPQLPPEVADVGLDGVPRQVELRSYVIGRLSPAQPPSTSTSRGDRGRDDRWVTDPPPSRWCPRRSRG